MSENRMRCEATDRLFEALLTLRDVEECYRFFSDLCTYGEVQAMSQRLEVAKKLREGMTFSKVSAETGVSSATIARVNKELHYGAGGYQMIFDRLREEKGE